MHLPAAVAHAETAEKKVILRRNAHKAEAVVDGLVATVAKKVILRRNVTSQETLRP